MANNAELLAWADRVRADFDRIGARLVDLDADPTTALLAAGGLTGSSAAPAAAAKAALDRMWALLPQLREQFDAVEEERARGRRADEARIGRLLTTPVIQPDPGLPGPSAAAAAPMTVADAMNLLVADLATAGDVIGRIGQAWRDGVPLIDDLRLRLDRTVAELGPFPEATDAAAVLARADAAAAGDPLQLAELLAPLRQADAEVERAAGALRERRDRLAADLDAATALLGTIDRTVRDGAVALDETRAKIAGPQGLLAPVDPVAVLDSPPRGLVPWLQRLRATAVTDWRAAVNGLEAWRSLADGVLATAETVLAANRAPLERRNELRGLLSSLAAKASAGGRDAPPEVALAHRHARELLHRAPCDLTTAEAAVDSYARLVGAGHRSGREPGAGT